MPFEHEFIPTPKLEQITGKKGRVYVDENGFKYPSITTVLGDDPEKKKALMEWRKRVGEEKAKQITRVSAIRGTTLHKAVETYLLNQPLKLGKESREYFYQIKPILDNHIGKIIMLENRLISHDLKVAGTVDCIAEFDGELAVIDFKTSRSIKKVEYVHDYFLQATAYTYMAEELGLTVKKIVIIMIPTISDEKPKVFVRHRDKYNSELFQRIIDYTERNDA